MPTPGAEARKVRSMSRQVVVALPAWVRRRLDVRPGAVVYWHRHRKGEVVLAARVERGAGQPGRHDLEAELAQVIAERDELKRRLRAEDLVERREVFASGVQQGIKLTVPLDVQVSLLREQVQELLNYQRDRRRRAASRVGRPVGRRAQSQGTGEATAAPVAVPVGYELERRPSAVEGLDLADVKDR